MKIFGKSMDEWITMKTPTYLGAASGIVWLIWLVWVTNSEYSWLSLLF